MSIRHLPFDYGKIKGYSISQRISSENFRSNYKNLGDKQKAGYVNCVFCRGTPHAFSACPLLWEELCDWLAKEIEVDSRCIGLAGSGQIGYSLRPDKFGEEFGPGSDLDFTLLMAEFLLW